MIPPLLPGLKAQRYTVRLGSLLIKLALFLPLPLLSQGRTIMVANVPFEFSVNGKVLPAGEYIVYRDSQSIYSLRARNGLMATRMMVYDDSRTGGLQESKLVFRTGTESYRLESFWMSGSCQGVRLVSSRQKRHMLVAHDTPGTVMVAAISEMPIQK